MHMSCGGEVGKRRPDEEGADCCHRRVLTYFRLTHQVGYWMAYHPPSPLDSPLFPNLIIIETLSCQSR